MENAIEDETVYDKLCYQELKVDKATSFLGKEWLMRFKTFPLSSKFDENPNLWIALALYFTGVQSQTNNGLKLTILLQKTNLNLCQLFSIINRFPASVLPQEVLRATNKLQNRIAVGQLLFTKYCSLWENYSLSVSSSEQEGNHAFELGWHVFSIALVELHYRDLSDQYVLLVAVVYTLLTGNNYYRVQPVEAQVAAALNSLGSSISPSFPAPRKDSLVEMLCSTPHISTNRVESASKKLRQLLLKLSHDEVIVHRLAKKILEGGSYFSKDCVNLSIEGCVQYFEKYYMNDIACYDPRYFLKDQVGIPAWCAATEYQYDASRSIIKDSLACFRTFEWQVQGHKKCGRRAKRLPSAQPPKKAAVEVEQWVSKILLKSAKEPSLFLNGIFSAEMKNQIRMITLAVEEMKAFCKSQLGENLRSSIPGSDDLMYQVTNLGCQLYYDSMESLFRDERTDCSVKQLLKSTVFNRSMLTCSFEVAFYAHRMSGLGFPRILEAYHLKEFDFFIIISPFLRYCGGLPRILRHHMQRLENTIALSHIWKEGSGIYRAIYVRGIILHMGSSFTNPGNRTTLTYFYRKFLVLCANRLHRFGTGSLELGISTLSHVWTVLKECVLKNSYSLFKNRHVDTILACTIYGVCKTNQVDSQVVSFQSLIRAYKKAFPEIISTRKIFSSILLSNGKKGDIIEFYNTCYVPKMKEFILRIHSLEFRTDKIQRVGKNAELFSHVSNRSTEVKAARVAADIAASASYPDRKEKGEIILEENKHIYQIPKVESLPINLLLPTRITATNLFVSTCNGIGVALSTKANSSASYSFGKSPPKDLKLINQAIIAKRDT